MPTPRAAKIAVALAAASLSCHAFSAVSKAPAVEAKNMQRLGHSDLQGRPAYQPNLIRYPDGRVMLFVGTHKGSAPNPLNGGAVEPNGTLIVDVTDPRRPVEKGHIPASGGQSQMVRMCLGVQLPGGQPGKVYLLRNIQDGPGAGFELWDVSDPGRTAPTLLKELRNLRSTHKHWWECSTGIAYMPGSKNETPGPTPLWRTSQAMLIYDWGRPHDGKPPVYIRTYGLAGAQPNGTGTPPPALHGAISAYEHPRAGQKLARGATADDVAGNRIYAAWGVGKDGVLQIIDRNKLLTPDYGGIYTGDPDFPTAAQLEEAQVGLLALSPDQGGHTSMPIFGVKPRSEQCHKEFTTRDIVVLASEATANRCNEAPHWAFLVDVTVENSASAPPGTRVEQSRWQGPMVLSTMSVDPRLGEKYPRGNYCTRGARFGVHSTEENFRNPYYGRLTFLAYFAGGVRVWDIREPQAPVEVAFYVPQANAHTQPPGYMTNNVEIDDRGYVYIVDRAGSGLDILDLNRTVKDLGLGKADGGSCFNQIPPGAGGSGGG
jgi:hypothetical protein